MLSKCIVGANRATRGDLCFWQIISLDWPRVYRKCFGSRSVYAALIRLMKNRIRPSQRRRTQPSSLNQLRLVCVPRYLVVLSLKSLLIFRGGLGANRSKSPSLLAWVLIMRRLAAICQKWPPRKYEKISILNGKAWKPQDWTWHTTNSRLFRPATLLFTFSN